MSFPDSPHSLLKRQLKCCFGEGFQVPAEWQRFVAAVDDAYREFDFDREMLERSLDLSSQELLQGNAELKATFESTPNGILIVDERGVLVNFNSKFARMWHLSEDLVLSKADDRLLNFVLEQVQGSETFTEKIRSFSARPDAESFDIIELRDGRIIEIYTQPLKLKERCIGRVWCFRDVTQRERLEKELLWKNAFLEALVTCSIDGLLVVDNDGTKLIQNRRLAELWKLPPEIFADRSDRRQVEFVTNRTKNPVEFLNRVEYLYSHPDQTSCDEVELTDGTVLERYSYPVVDTNGRHYGRLWTFRDFTARKKAEADLERTYRHLMRASRQAGMAEVAISVLHNVGNVLNSVNVSSTLLCDWFRKPSARRLEAVLQFLQDRLDEGGQLVLEREKASELLRYLEALDQEREASNARVLKEANSLFHNVKHIMEIVALQKAHASDPCVFETTSAAELVEDALRVMARSYEGNGISAVCDIAAAPRILVDRHKSLQILVNLLQNAECACRCKPAEERKVTISVGLGESNRVEIKISDNGEGILPEHLARVFSPGFTTWKDGHGFSLHSGGLAAKEMGGRLTVQSGGAGTGATFTLSLPVQAT
jgi:PAS domain S-box-containing protein